MVATSQGLFRPTGVLTEVRSFPGGWLTASGLLGVGTLWGWCCLGSLRGRTNVAALLPDTPSLPGTNCPHPQGSPPGGGGSSSSNSRIRGAGTRAAMAGRRADRRTDGQKQRGLRCRRSLSDPCGHRFLAPPLAACSGNPARRRERRGGERGPGGGADAPPSLRARRTSRGHAGTPAPSGRGRRLATPDVAFCASDTFRSSPPPASQFPVLGPEGASWGICVLTLGGGTPALLAAGGPSCARRILTPDPSGAGDQGRWWEQCPEQTWAHSRHSINASPFYKPNPESRRRLHPLVHWVDSSIPAVILPPSPGRLIPPLRASLVHTACSEGGNRQLPGTLAHLLAQESLAGPHSCLFQTVCSLTQDSLRGAGANRGPAIHRGAEVWAEPGKWRRSGDYSSC